MRSLKKETASLLIVVITLAFCFVVFFSPVSFAAGTRHPNGWYWPTGSASTGGYLGWMGYNSGYGGWHLGQDFKSSASSPVYAVAEGTVLEARSDVSNYGPGGSKGGAVVIRHRTSNNVVFIALYGHLQGIRVSKGQSVNAGQTIGQINNFNPSHLHFGIHPGSGYPPDGNIFRGYTYGKSTTYGWTDPISFLNRYYQRGIVLALTTPVHLSFSVIPARVGSTVIGSFTILNTTGSPLVLERLKISIQSSSHSQDIFGYSNVTLEARSAFAFKSSRKLAYSGAFRATASVKYKDSWQTIYNNNTSSFSVEP